MSTFQGYSGLAQCLVLGDKVEVDETVHVSCKDQQCHVCSGGDNCSSSRCETVTTDNQCTTCRGGCSGSCSGTTNCQDPEARPTVVGCSVPLWKEGNSVPDAAMKHLIRVSIGEYPMDQVRYRLVTEQIIPADKIETAIAEFRKFVTVILYASGSVGMISPIVDEVWHAFILHTVDYHTFCHDTLGRFLHHQPNTPATPSHSMSVPNFLNGYKELFGELDPIWTAHMSAHCTDSVCDSGELCGG